MLDLVKISPKLLQLDELWKQLQERLLPHHAFTGWIPFPDRALLPSIQTRRILYTEM